MHNCGRRIDTKELTVLCQRLDQLILNIFTRVNITPNLHKVLAHAPNIISGFDNGLGLEQLSEELGASNKLIRRYRERLSRKFSFQDNINFTRILFQSDSVLLQNRKLKKSVPDNCVVLEDISKQEILVNSLLLPEDD